jgi:hypothetical protein
VIIIIIHLHLLPRLRMGAAINLLSLYGMGKENSTSGIKFIWFNVHTVHIGHSRNNRQYALIVPLLYSVYGLLHVSAVAMSERIPFGLTV